MNLRIPLTSVVLVFASYVAEAQGGYQRMSNTSYSGSDVTGYVTLNGGFANVVGNWGFAVSPTYNGTYALNGSSENISAGIPIGTTGLGIAAMIGFYDNPFDLNDFAYNASYNADAYSPDGADDYGAVNFMAGLFYTIPVKRWSFDFRAMIGYLHLDLPEVQYTTEINTPSTAASNIYDSYDIASSSGGGLAYDIGVGVRYSFRRVMCVALTFDYLGASIPFSTIQTDQNIDQNGNYNYPAPTPISGTVPVNLFSINLGIGYQFGMR